MQATFNINTSAVTGYADKLKTINRSAFPVAIRQTLNKAAYDVKTNTMPKQADRFIHRKPTFFKANSRVEQAQGFKVDSMKAIVGFMPKPNDSSHSVEDLEQQEHGGNIKNRSFIATAKGRVNKSWRGNVAAKNRLSKIRKTIFDSKSKSLNESVKAKERFVLSAIYAKKGGHVLNQSHTRVLEILSVKRVKGNTQIKSRVIYSVKRNRAAKVKDTHFMLKASLDSAHKMEQYFTEIATKKINSIP